MHETLFDKFSGIILKTQNGNNVVYIHLASGGYWEIRKFHAEALSCTRNTINESINR